MSRCVCVANTSHTALDKHIVMSVSYWSVDPNVMHGNKDHCSWRLGDASERLEAKLWMMLSENVRGKHLQQVEAESVHLLTS